MNTVLYIKARREGQQNKPIYSCNSNDADKDVKIQAAKARALIECQKCGLPECEFVIEEPK